MWQASPLAAGPQAIKNGVDRFAERRGGLSPPGRSSNARERFLEEFPFRVGQIGIVSLTVYRMSHRVSSRKVPLISDNTLLIGYLQVK